MLKKKVGGFSRLPCKIFVLKGLPFFVKCLDVNARVSAKQCRFVDSKHLKNSSLVNPIPTGHGWNQPIYERHVIKSGRNRVKPVLHSSFAK